jgi:hypothetical protein
LWFTHVPVPEMIYAAGMTKSGIGGHWINGQFSHLAQIPGIDIGVVTAFSGLQAGKIESDSAFDGVTRNSSLIN